MKAILRDDIIISISSNGVEIGNFPKDVGFERLRFDGERVVDLMDLNKIWVKHLGGTTFELHAIEVKDSRMIEMGYVDRNRLFVNDGDIKLMSIDDLNDRKKSEKAKADEDMKLKKQVASFINELNFNEIDTLIDTVFNGLTTKQRTSLKQLYKAVLFVCKRSLQ